MDAPKQLTMKSRTIIVVAFFTTFGLRFFVESQLPFVLISILCLFLGIRVFVQDKKELKAAEYYSRLDIEVPWWNYLTALLIIVLIQCGIYLISEKYLDEFRDSTNLYSIFPLLSISLFDKYQNFINAIRSFENGIKLPGRNSIEINWNAITKIRRNGTQALILIGQEEYHFQIDARDLTDFDSIIECWTDNNVTMNTTIK